MLATCGMYFELIIKHCVLTVLVSPKRKLGKYEEDPPGLPGPWIGLFIGDPRVMGSI